METVAAPRVSAPRLVDPSGIPVTTAPPTPIPPRTVPRTLIGTLLNTANQRTPDFAKHKCKHFLSTLLLVYQQENVKNLIQGKAVEGLGNRS